MHWAKIILIAVLVVGNSSLSQLALQAGYTVEYYSQVLDHINGDPGLINIKVLLKTGNPGGPLFVYTGNEGPIEDFFEMTGWLVYNLGPQYGATVAFIEHRYYGDSLPIEMNYAYLNTDQVLLDFANIILQLKPTEITPVIVFGGSYGAMLSAYFRIKFPHIVDGAIASSGPVLEYLDTQGKGLNHRVTADYFEVYPGCAFNINDGFNILDNFIQNEYTWPALSAIFSLCNVITEQQQVLDLEAWIGDALETYAQLNYPYPASIGGTTLPAYPLNVSCSYIGYYNRQPRNMWATLLGLAQAVGLLYNSTGTTTCYAPSASYTDQSAESWGYQTCSELLIPQGSYGLPNDLFPAVPFVLSQFSAQCLQTYGVQPNLAWYPLNYGFTSYYTYSLRNLSNVVFSYGSLDPWESGCIKESPNPNVHVIRIKGAAHHAELRRPNRNDPLSVIYARRIEQQFIESWLSF